MSERVPRPEKVKKVEELKALMEKAKAIYLVDFTGLNVAEITELRSRLKKKGIHFEVVKNTLTRIALRELKLDEFAEILVGPNSIIVSMEDPVEPVKIISEFKEEFEKPEFRGGYVFGRLFDKEGIEVLGKLPPLQDLRAHMVGTIKAPLQGLVWTLKGLLTKLVLDLKSLQRKKEEVS